MPGCPDLLTIQSYVDGELSRADAESVGRHLLDCDDCREIAERLRLTSALLAAALPASPPADLLLRIEAAVAKRGRGIGCEEAHEYIQAAVDGELEPGRAELLRAHLTQCADCRHYQERTRVTVHALRAVDHVTPPAGLRTRIEAAVDAVAYSPFARLRRRLVNVAGLAAAAAILMVAILSSRGVLLPGGVVSHTDPAATIGVTSSGRNIPAASSQPVSAPDADDSAYAATADTHAAVTSAAPADLSGTDRLATASAMKRRLKAPAAARSIAGTPPTVPSASGPPEMAVAATPVSVCPLVGAGPVSVGPTRGGAVPLLEKKAPVETASLVGGIPSGLVTEAPVVLTSTAPRPTLAKATPTTPVSLRSDTAPAHAPVGRRLPTVDESSSRSVHRSTPSPERLALAEARIDRQLGTSTVATELPSPW